MHFIDWYFTQWQLYNNVKSNQLHWKEWSLQNYVYLDEGLNKMSLKMSLFKISHYVVVQQHATSPYMTVHYNSVILCSIVLVLILMFNS